MGKVKEAFHDEIIRQIELLSLSRILGITFDDLEKLEWDIEADSSEEGLIYNYRIVFSPESPQEILQKISNLERGDTVYVPPWVFDEEYIEDEQFEAITQNKDIFNKFKNEIYNLKNLNAMVVPTASLRETLNRQIFIGVIGTLETFLSETFIRLVNDNEQYFRNFVKTCPAFKQRKFELNQIFDVHDKLNDIVKHEMLSVIYHNLTKVRNMYISTFNVEFPDISEMNEYILKRHDLVHRGGKTKSGDSIELDQMINMELLDKAQEFVVSIASRLPV